uniref:Chromatin modification-related protein n=1 Tax=Mycena chlorophos TaxID=658473 RepID=A0ABQ0M8R9_MYCCL|nr:predicted protein [Mycena chlorophos]
MPPRIAPPPPVPEARESPQYALILLQEYTQTLSALPIELSRNFADLRELDAVLSSSQTSLISKITLLTEMIESGTGQQEQRMWLLNEIAEEATRLRLGGEDKIKVACAAADNLKTHDTYLRQLAQNIPGFNANALNRHTTYPHVASKPKAEGTRARPGARKKVERAPSPTESLVSVTSHLPTNGRAQASTSRAANGAAKRARPSANRVGSNQPAEFADPAQPQTNGHSRNGNGRDFNVPPTNGHPSLASYQNGNGNGHAYEGTNGSTDWTPPHPQTLEGPGMPVRNGSAQPAQDPAPPDGTDNDGDADDQRLYCLCQRQSFGDMVACDGDACRWEWFHLACLGMTATPQGDKWYCDDCKAKNTTTKRSTRGGRRKASARATPNGVGFEDGKARTCVQGDV